jgi:hypothetical protein
VKDTQVIVALHHIHIMFLAVDAVQTLACLLLQMASHIHVDHHSYYADVVYGRLDVGLVCPW